jgi:uncharacterized RDD family membrane protein YckC
VKNNHFINRDLFIGKYANHKPTTKEKKMSEQVPAGAAPAPAAASAVPGELATYGQRILAFLIDVGVLIVIGIICGILGYILGKIAGPLALIATLLNLVASIGYFVYLWGMDNPITGRGQTVGKKLMGIKVIKADGQDMGPVDAILRFVGYIVSEITFGIGYIWIFIDADNQGFHDKIAKTYVIKAD